MFLCWTTSVPLLNYLSCPGPQVFLCWTTSVPLLELQVFLCWTTSVPLLELQVFLCWTTSVPLLDYKCSSAGLQVFLCWNTCPALDYKCSSAWLPALPWTTSVPLLDYLPCPERWWRTWPRKPCRECAGPPRGSGRAGSSSPVCPATGSCSWTRGNNDLPQKLDILAEICVMITVNRNCP